MSRSYRFVTCIIAGLTGCFCFLRIGHRFLAQWLTQPVISGISITFFLIAMGYGIYWAFTGKGRIGASPTTLAFWRGLIRYAIAINLIMIGIQGIFQYLFFVHLAVLDQPFSSLNGEELTWAYFGHYSRGFVYLISSIQIIGSLLLLFSRTNLAGVFVLLPVMFAIVALNYFFDMEFAETIHALVLFIALLYLLFDDARRIWQTLFRSTPTISVFPKKYVLVKNLVRASCLLIPVLLIWRMGSPDLNPWLTGTYKVSHLAMDGQVVTARNCTDSLLTSVYLDLGNDCVFDFNGLNRRWYGTYYLNDDNKQITITWRYPLHIRDTLMGKISKDGTGNLVVIDGKIGKHSMQVSLIKQGRN